MLSVVLSMWCRCVLLGVVCVWWVCGVECGIECVAFGVWCSWVWCQCVVLNMVLSVWCWVWFGYGMGVWC